MHGYFRTREKCCIISFFLLLQAPERLKAPGELGGGKHGEEITVNKSLRLAVKKERNENMYHCLSSSIQLALLKGSRDGQEFDL